MSVEHGQTYPSVFLAYKIAAALGVPVSHVFYLDADRRVALAGAAGPPAGRACPPR